MENERCSHYDEIEGLIYSLHLKEILKFSDIFVLLGEDISAEKKLKLKKHLISLVVESWIFKTIAIKSYVEEIHGDAKNVNNVEASEMCVETETFLKHIAMIYAEIIWDYEQKTEVEILRIAETYNFDNVSEHEM